jgi:hypothetical protein
VNLGTTKAVAWILLPLLLLSPSLLAGVAETVGEGTVIVAYETPKVFDVTIDDVAYPVLVDANSTLYGFRFDPANTLLALNLSGADGTVGVCTVTFPNALLVGPYLCYVDDVLVAPVETANATHTALSVTYTHSVRTLTIIGTTVIPEFSLPIAVALALLTGGALMLLRRRVAPSR